MDLRDALTLLLCVAARGGQTSFCFVFLAGLRVMWYMVCGCVGPIFPQHLLCQPAATSTEC